MTVSTGSRLGVYEIVELIGAGGMGEVYRARDTRLNRLVAIKVLPRRIGDSPEALERFTPRIADRILAEPPKHLHRVRCRRSRPPISMPRERRRVFVTESAAMTCRRHGPWR